MNENTEHLWFQVEDEPFNTDDHELTVNCPCGPQVIPYPQCALVIHKRMDN